MPIYVLNIYYNLCSYMYYTYTINVYYYYTYEHLAYVCPYVSFMYIY